VAQANIPKVMNITPQILGVDKFIKDAGRITTSVNRMTTGVNKAITRLNKAPVNTSNLASGLTQTTTAATKSTIALTGTATAMSKLATQSAAVGKAGSLRALNQSVTTYKAMGTAISNVGAKLSSGLSSLNKWASGVNFSNNAATKFGGSLIALGSTVTRLSFQIERLGRSMFMAFTLPIAAIGYASVKAFSEFETGMAKVAMLVTDNAEALDKWEKHIRSTAVSLAALPTDMADGLFAVASGFGSAAGQRADTVIEVLDASTKASKIGLGEVADIGRTATAMMNAFGEANLGAEAAVSLLVLAVREGNLEVDTLTSSLGNVLGTTAAIGGSADDVLAFVSAYTQIGVAPAVAVTSLNTTLTSLIKPTATAREVLESYGLTLEEIKTKIAGPGGLANLLVNMRKDMSETDFYALFPRRALRGALAVTGTDMNEFYDTYLRIAKDMQKEADNTVDAMTNSYKKGSEEWKLTQQEIQNEGLITPSVLAQAWDIFGDTLAARFQMFSSQMQSIFLGVGSAFEPIIKEIMDKILAFLMTVDTFVRENQESVKLLTYIALGIAALGPGIIIAAKLAQAFGVFASGLGYVVKGIGKVVGGMINLVFHSARLAIVIGVSAVKAFVLFIAGIVRAAFGVGVLIANLVILIATQIGNWIATLAGQLVTLSAGFLSSAVSAGVTFVSGIFAAAASLIPFIAAIGGVAGALILIGGGVLAAIGAFSELGSRVGDAVSDVRANITTMTDGIGEQLNAMSEDGKSWGFGLMAAYNDGLIEGIIYVVDTLITLANWITSMFSTNSPPRILPDIDKWGQETMQVWIDGWGKADFGIFNTISGVVKSFLGSILSDDDEGKEGSIISRVLGTRQ